MAEIRATNLLLAREMNYGTKYTGRKLEGVLNMTYFSKMAHGGMQMSDVTARRVEAALDLPCGWLDRDNSSLLKLTKSQFDLFSLVLSLSEPKQLALTHLLI